MGNSILYVKKNKQNIYDKKVEEDKFNRMMKYNTYFSSKINSILNSKNKSNIKKRLIKQLIESKFSIKNAKYIASVLIK